MYIYNFYLVYDKSLYENLLRFGDVSLCESKLVGEEILWLERDTKMSEEELAQMKSVLEKEVGRKFAHLRNRAIVYEVWEV